MGFESDSTARDDRFHWFYIPEFVTLMGIGFFFIGYIFFIEPFTSKPIECIKTGQF